MVDNKEASNNSNQTNSFIGIHPGQSIRNRLKNLNEEEKTFLMPLYAAICSERDFRIIDLDKLSQTDDIPFEKRNGYINYDLDIIKVYDIYLDILVTIIGEEFINKSIVPKKDQ